METKRCPFCQKLQRASAQTCSRCGRAFTEKKPRWSRVITASSVPIASPHRAGHHSGLHPEDLPYLSSQIEALHLPEQDDGPQEQVWQPARREPEQLVLPPGSSSAGATTPGAPTVASPAADLDTEADLVTLPSKTIGAEIWKERPI